MSLRLRGLTLFEHKGIESIKIGSALPKGVKKGSGVHKTGFRCRVSGVCSLQRIAAAVTQADFKIRKN